MSLISALLALCLGARADTPEDVLNRARDAQRVESSIQSVKMTLVARNGAERVRELELRIRRDGDVLKTYTRFTAPSDVAGTQLVVVDHPDRADEQLLYLPALKRVNRIAGTARSGSFMGSDLSFEDLEMSGIDQAKHSLVSESAEGWVIDTTPAAGSSYGRIRSSVSRADMLPRKVEYFDLADKPVKVMEILATEKDGATVLPTRTEVRNLVKGTTTRLEITAHRLNVPLSELPDETFTAAYMERGG